MISERENIEILKERYAPHTGYSFSLTGRWVNLEYRVVEGEWEVFELWPAMFNARLLWNRAVHRKRTFDAHIYVAVWIPKGCGRQKRYDLYRKDSV